MKIYYYHNVPISEYYDKWLKGKLPGQILYGITHLIKRGHKCVWHDIPFNPYTWRIRLAVYNLFKILFTPKEYEILYATTVRGIELLIILRALGVYQKPIALWHHTAVTNPKNKIRDFFSKLLYKGIDYTFFFSEELRNRSLLTKKIYPDNASVIHWGGDLDFYDSYTCTENNGFVSTGKEKRDFKTLISAINNLDYSFEILLGSKHYLDIVKTCNNPNARFYDNWIPVCQSTKAVADAYAILICVLDFPYTLGLTTLVEAMALGKPIISTRNITFPFDIEKEGIGLLIDYGDVDGWKKAIVYIAEHPEEAYLMGQKGKRLAKKMYNLDIFSKEIETELLSILPR